MRRPAGSGHFLAFAANMALVTAMALSSGATSASAAEPSFNVISEIIRGSSGSPRGAEQWNGVSADGQTAYGRRTGDSRPVAWTIEDGQTELIDSFPATAEFNPLAASGDASVFLGRGAPPRNGGARGPFQAEIRTVGGETIPITGPIFGNGDPNFREVGLSNNGQYVVGSRVEGDPGSRRAHAYIWDSENLARELDYGRFSHGATVIGVMDDGSAYGNAVRITNDTPGSYSIGAAQGVRWDTDGNIDPLTGIDGSGNTWNLTRIFDISLDGTQRLGSGEISRNPTNGSRPALTDVYGVFSDSGPDWILWEGSIANGEYPGIFTTLILSGDGSTVAGRRYNDNGDVENVIWTRENGAIVLEVMMEAVGLDRGSWVINSIVDISHDGKTLLAQIAGPQAFRAYALITVPEPGTGLLFAFGLVMLSARRSSARK